MPTRTSLSLLCLASFLAMSLAPGLAQQPDPKKGWIPLFNGKDLSGWKPREGETPKPNGWKVVDGVYVNTPPSTDIVTEREFYDFDLYAEVKLTETTNSGLYLRDKYEVQILNSFGKPLSDNMCGAL
jgi:3-keto-disaccharide hydrolase